MSWFTLEICEGLPASSTNVHGWKNLVLPGMAMGLLGYAVGNYLGFATAYVLKALLGQ